MHEKTAFALLALLIQLIKKEKEGAWCRLRITIFTVTRERFAFSTGIVTDNNEVIRSMVLVCRMVV